MTNNRDEFPVFFFSFIYHMKLRVASAQNYTAGTTNENTESKPPFWAEVQERASVKQRMWEESSFWIFFSFTFPFSSYWPCPKCSFSHRAAMWQLCSHLKSPKPTFSNKSTRRGDYVDQRESKKPPLTFSKTIYSTGYHSERNSVCLAREPEKGTPGQRV